MGLRLDRLRLKKALVLFARSNPPLMEWLRSPVVYRDDGWTAPALRRLGERYFSRLAGVVAAIPGAPAVDCDELDGTFRDALSQAWR